MLTRKFLDERLVPELEYGTVQYYEHVRRYLFAQQFAAGKYVVDIACGTGYGTAMLKRARAAHVVGIDLATDALHYARHHWPSLPFMQANGECLPLAAASQDLAVSFETLAHVTNPTVFLAEIRRVLVRSGWFIISIPNRLVASPQSATPFSPYVTFEPTLDEFKHMLNSSGWRIERLHGLTHSERMARVRRTAIEPFSEPGKALAWSAHIRHIALSSMPPFVYRRLARQRQFDISDTLLTEQADNQSVDFIALCRID